MGFFIFLSFFTFAAGYYSDELPPDISSTLLISIIASIFWPIILIYMIGSFSRNKGAN
jgi:hypothetical protein